MRSCDKRLKSKLCVPDSRWRKRRSPASATTAGAGHRNTLARGPKGNRDSEWTPPTNREQEGFFTDRSALVFFDHCLGGLIVDDGDDPFFQAVAYPSMTPLGLYESIADAMDAIKAVYERGSGRAN
jgi:hypothetical protein